MREAPDYEPPRKNLALLGGQSEVALGETAAVAPPQRPPSKPSKTKVNHRSPKRKTELVWSRTTGWEGEFHGCTGSNEAPPLASFKAIETQCQSKRAVDVASARFAWTTADEPRAFPEASAPPVLPGRSADEMVEFYALIFCQGGFRQRG